METKTKTESQECGPSKPKSPISPMRSRSWESNEAFERDLALAIRLEYEENMKRTTSDVQWCVITKQEKHNYNETVLADDNDSFCYYVCRDCGFKASNDKRRDC